MTVVDVPKPDATQTWDPGDLFTTNTYMYNTIVSAMDTAVIATMEGGEEPGSEFRADLDSHANMPVVGHGAFVLADLNKRMDVSPYSPDYKPLSVPLVDAAIKYESPYDEKTNILVIRNALRNGPSFVTSIHAKRGCCAGEGHPKDPGGRPYREGSYNNLH